MWPCSRLASGLRFESRPPLYVFKSLKIGSAFGIPIKIHWTFIAMVLWLMYFLDVQPAQFLAYVTVLAGCVLLHEIGHSLVAKHYGIHIIDITLWPLGGMARMHEIPEDSKIEGLVAVAGPAVNFALALLGGLAAIVSELAGLWALRDPLAFFIAGNLMLGAFNLLPAFPMDGGRVLRAWLGRKRTWLEATEIAVSVGRICAGFMFAAAMAFMLLGGKSSGMLPLIPLFIWFSGTRELWVVRFRHAQAQFGQGGGMPFGAPFQAPPAERSSTPPQGEWQEPPDIASGKQSGFSQDDVRKLEQYRGRLRKPPED